MLLLNTDKKQYVKLVKYTWSMCLLKCLKSMFWVDSLVKLRKSLPTSQARFPQFRVSERFCVMGSNNRTVRGAL